MIITKENKMADVIHMNYSTLSVLNRFGIELGFGDKSVEDVCQKHHVDINFFLEIINTFINEDYFPKKHLQSFSITLINDYLKKTHDYYHQVKVPAIEQLMAQMAHNCYTQRSNINLLTNFFNDYKQELLNHTQREDKIVFPYTLAIEKAFNATKIDKKTVKLMEDYSIDIFESEHDNIEEKLFDLKNIIIKYLPQPKNFQLCNKLLDELFTLEKDLNDHARIEDKVLVPKIRAMESVIRKKFSEK